jgi:predicted Zn-dependent protease
LAALRGSARREIFDQALAATEAAGLVGAGDITLSASSRLLTNIAGFAAYTHRTYGEFTLTARTTDGLGSGWGWSGFEDWARVDAEAVITRAVDLARRSAKPVAVEPGRYTVILEPTAVAPLLLSIDWGGPNADAGMSVFSKEPVGTTKLGLQVVDSRVSMVSDPWDPELPESTVHEDGYPVSRMVRIEAGILKALVYGEAARRKGLEPIYPPQGLRLAVKGPATSLEEMIATTKRGIWVNRLSGAGILNPRTHLLTGTTRDGTFLIENGKITKAVKNLRYTESPFFILNKLEAWGEPVRAHEGIVAPRLKVRDFDFTGLTDAI